MPDANPRTFDLHDFMPYLFARVGTLMEQSFTPAMKAKGLTIDTWRVLMVLHFDGPMTLVDLSRVIGVKTPTLSRMIGRMVDDGLISRRRSSRDTRTVEISLRRRGEQVFQDLWPTAAETEGLVLDQFSPVEAGRLKDALRTIEGVLVAHIEGQARNESGNGKSR
jgi:DNA-binding MarR family transcriptional regulator